MKKASIVSIGNEILSGLTVDTNAAYLSGQMASIGLPVVSGYTVGDSIGSIVRAIKQACNDADIILVTGGLGPTDDDLTRQGVAELLGVPLKFENELLQKIKQRYASRNIEMSEINKVQAFLPTGTKPLANNHGTAPGIAAEHEGKLIFVMPGVPGEMKHMFAESVLDRVKQQVMGQVVVARRLKCFGTGESNIAELLGSMMKRDRNPVINCTVTCGVITLHIIATAENQTIAKEMIEKDEKHLRSLLGDLVYGSGDESLAEVVGKKLRHAGKTVAVAESCTGGLICKMITDMPGASEYFLRGWVTYSNEAKIDELGMEKKLIEEHGAVSQEVAMAMAKGARLVAGADFGISITGIAGPGGGNELKPVGLVYIGLDSDRGCQVKNFVFSHDRSFVRKRTAQTALNILRLML